MLFSKTKLLIFLIPILSLYYIQININNRSDEHWPFAISLVVDGMDCPIQEPNFFDQSWFSHKMNGPAVRYELASSIQHGIICWTNGPYQAGTWPDQNIFFDGLVDYLLPGEMVHADQGYRNRTGEPWNFITPVEPVTLDVEEGHKLARACHESINGRFKRFGVLNSPFRHELEKHGICFRAIASLVQLTLTVDEPAFSINYTE